MPCVEMPFKAQLVKKKVTYLCIWYDLHHPFFLSVDVAFYPLTQSREKYSCCQGKEGFKAINTINVQPRLIKACPEVVTHCHAFVSACAHISIWCFCVCVCSAGGGDDRFVSAIKHPHEKGQGLKSHTIRKTSSFKGATSNGN